MTELDDIAAFPNPGVRLLREDERIAVWEENFEPGIPTAPHRHTRDYVAIFPDAGELTVTPLAGDLEEYAFLAGSADPLPTTEGRIRFGFPAGTVIHARVPPAGSGHFAVNEGRTPARMILIEIKGTATERG